MRLSPLPGSLDFWLTIRRVAELEETRRVIESILSNTIIAHAIAVVVILGLGYFIAVKLRGDHPPRTRHRKSVIKTETLASERKGAPKGMRTSIRRRKQRK